MTNAQEAAAFWGGAENPGHTTEQRLSMALPALKFFGNAYDRVEDALDEISKFDCSQLNEYGTASRDAVTKIREALRG